jgi:two-component system sensor histidine kinase EvgS
MLHLGAREVGLNPEKIKELTDISLNGKEAMDMVTKSLLFHQNTYGLVITDCSMPVMDGY